MDMTTLKTQALPRGSVHPPAPRLRHALLAPLVEHWRAYLAMNAGFYGLVFLGMLAAWRNPSLQVRLVDSVRAASQQGFLSAVADAYRQHHVFWAIILTFLINLVIGSVLQLHVPSMIVPFLGLLFAGLRAACWGVLFSPLTRFYGREIIPHYLTLLVEGQAYVLAMVAVYVQARWVIPGAQPRMHAYFDGLRISVRIYKLVTIVLLVAAIYEAYEVIYLAPLLK